MFYLYLHYFQIGWDVVATLIRSVGPVYFVAMIAVFVAYHVASLASNIYLSKWTDDTTLQNFTAFPANSSLRMDRNNYYLSLYGGFGAAQGSIKFCLNFHFFPCFLGISFIFPFCHNHPCLLCHKHPNLFTKPHLPTQFTFVRPSLLHKVPFPLFAVLSSCGSYK